MSHQDARCASDSETILVSAGGTMPSVSALSGKRLVVVRGTVSGSTSWSLSGSQVSIVGQESALLAGPGASGATLHVSGGNLYIRGLTVSSGSPGLWANGGGVLRLERVSVSNNTAGGILIDGAGFDIRNTSVLGNGPNATDAVWAGMRIQNLSSSSSVPKVLSLTSVSSNQNVGIYCAAGTTTFLTPSPTSVLVSSNAGGVDITTSCGFASCGAASTSCGAQP